jgi:hypothetical protein
MPITINGNGTIDLGSNGAINLGPNLKFSGSLSGDPNTLDDYEEGTWTPYWSQSSGVNLFVGNTITVNHATYQKIGSWVHCSCYFNSGPSFSYNTGVTGSTPVYIGGLPFTAKNAFYAGSVGFYGWSSIYANGYTPMIISEDSDTTIRLQYAGGGNMVNMPASVILVAGSAIILHITYETSS